MRSLLLVMSFLGAVPSLYAAESVADDANALEVDTEAAQRAILRLSRFRNYIMTRNTELTALVPDRYLFSDGETGNMIADGGDDMYDGGNVLNTDLAAQIPYTNNVVTASPAFGPSSSYVTLKFPGVFALAAANMDITRFLINGFNGADGAGTADAFSFTRVARGEIYTVLVKRVFGAGDPSINHIVIVPTPDPTHTWATNTDLDDHAVEGLEGAASIYYLLVASTAGRRLDDGDFMALVDRILEQLD